MVTASYAGYPLRRRGTEALGIAEGALEKLEAAPKGGWLTNTTPSLRDAPTQEWDMSVVGWVGVINHLLDRRPAIANPPKRQAN